MNPSAVQSAQPSAATATSLINAACRKYLEAVEKLRRIETDWQTLPTQDAVALILGIQAILRETRQFLEQGTFRMSDITASACRDVADGNTWDQIAECRRKACDLADRVNETLTSSERLIWRCLARQEAQERRQTAKALSIVIAGTILGMGTALYLFLR